ncbi:MAG: hypothetical protein Athens071424_130 [Parcubacteria group bacterium Athens0714_24]|nr:MAG: hypothetical protein Athens071424_130 [Parcubacteria group bacterium Athens0714_24]
MATITISKEKILKQKGVVVLPLKEYQMLCERAVPVYCLSGKEAEEVDKLAKRGLKEYRAGKCRTIKSLADLD